MEGWLDTPACSSRGPISCTEQYPKFCRHVVLDQKKTPTCVFETSDPVTVAASILRGKLLIPGVVHSLGWSFSH